MKKAKIGTKPLKQNATSANDGTTLSAKKNRHPSTKDKLNPSKCKTDCKLEQARMDNACFSSCKKQSDQDKQQTLQVTGHNHTLEDPELSHWYWELKEKRVGCPPSSSHFRTTKYRWQEEANQPCSDCRKRKFINPYETKKKALSGGLKRKIVKRWGQMWDSALSDLQFDRIAFENNPDAEQTYKNDDERIEDGCRKLWSIARMNQNIITMMMKKFVSGPPNILYSLNRIEAAQCWNRIINDQGLVKGSCCDHIRTKGKVKYNISSLQVPKQFVEANLLTRNSMAFRLPKPHQINEEQTSETEIVEEVGKHRSKLTSPYWLDPKRVPPVPPGFKEEEFYIEPKNDPTGEIRRDLKKAKEIARRYTRFAHVIEKAIQVVPNLDKVNQIMDENFVADDPAIRRQTLLHNFFSSQKMDTSPEFRRDALYATILSRNDNPKDTVVKKPFPYVLAEMSKSKSKSRVRE